MFRPQACRPLRPSAFAPLALIAALAALVLLPGAARAASPCTPPVVNKLACENQTPGADPATWEVNGDGDDTIQGFATQMSVNPGDAIGFKVKSATTNYHIDVFRLGYYGGK